MASEYREIDSSRIPGFFKLSVSDRIKALHERGLLSDSDIRALEAGTHTLRTPVANRMIENVVGVFGLPLGLGLNFLIDGREYIVPLAVEEPSIVAGLSGAARTARLSGGIVTSTTDPILIGQVQVTDLTDVEAAREKLLANRIEILNLANSLHPKMLARGGGAKEIEVHTFSNGETSHPMLVLHLLVDTRDAMGANVVNGMCEGVASLVESITEGKVFLRILSNLTDRAIVRATMSISAKDLAFPGYSGTEVRDGIVLASELALVDRYRAVTHNKGIMNGVDAVALATGNDFRAIEAAAHAYAARNGTYSALTRWFKNDQGDLQGELEMPMKVGTVGGSLETNPTVRINHRLLGSPDAKELASIMGAVGLAQNYAALRSLSTRGIQQNHMTLHARSVTSTARVPAAHFEEVVEALIEEGDIKVWKAKEILKRLQSNHTQTSTHEPRSSAFGKVIILGEHAVVYGRPALAAPIPLAMEARVVSARERTLVIPRWGIEQHIPSRSDNPQGLSAVLPVLLEQLKLSQEQMTIEVFPNVPRAMGLGGSAALAVAVVRSLSAFYKLRLSDEEVNDLAYQCELAAHGTPSGVDNTIATYGVPLTFQRNPNNSASTHQEIRPAVPMPMVVGISHTESFTANAVEQVRKARELHHEHYEGIFDQIASLTRRGIAAFQEGSFEELGAAMNFCHGYLNAMQLSTPGLEELVHIARTHGALGAKLTGAGGGGSILALCPENQQEVASAMENSGYQTLSFTLE